MVAPNTKIVSAIEAGTSYVTRRIEIFEADGTTYWIPENETLEKDLKLLVDGTISVDYDRDERRTLDLTLYNRDNILRPNPKNGFWYDKVIKVYRGVDYQADIYPPSIALVEVLGSGNIQYQVLSRLVSANLTDTDLMDPTTVTVEDVSDYDIVMAYTGASATGKSAMLTDLYTMGKKIITIGVGNDQTVLPFVTTSVSGAAMLWGVSPMLIDTPVAGAFTTGAARMNTAGRVITGLTSTSQQVARYTSGTFTNYIAAVVAENSFGGKWLHIHVPDLENVEIRNLLKAGIRWLRGIYTDTISWEVQMGEFVIDRIAEANFPNQMKVTCRDYTKRCMTSKFEQATEFTPETQIVALVRAIAANAGITKFRLPGDQTTIGKTISIERGKPRWDVMKDAAAAGNYEMFFDNEGYLVMRKNLDPTLSPVDAVFQTGESGNLVSFERAISDSRLYNHVCVYGDPAEGEEDRLPYFGEAKNEEPSSPTRINRIGDRLFTFASQFFTTDQQCQEYALSLLKLHALESYDFNFSSIYYPWLEAGTIAKVVDPDALNFEPDRFLISSIEFPLALGPMSIVGKRVTYVGSSDGNG